jgi:hypothetical protein
MGSLTINLIDGEFSPEDAKEILIDLINKKIQFHSLKSHENWERFGQVDDFAHSRIKSLESAREKIIDMSKFTFPNDFKLKIKSAIEIDGLNDF